MFDSIIDSFNRNLIQGNSYLFVIKGLLVTLEISVFGVLFGTVWGMILCFLRTSENRIFRNVSRFIIVLLRGSPVLLLLMFLYYVVFADIRINGIFVAVIAFALNSGAHFAEVMRSALEAVDKKQVEAARMLGFSKFNAFFAVTLPQSIQIAKPVYQNTVINLIQWTSVVGYIAITDLTRTLNNIGSRTGDPFFTLFFGIIVYLGLSYFVHAFFSLLNSGNKRV